MTSDQPRDQFREQILGIGSEMVGITVLDPGNFPTDYIWSFYNQNITNIFCFGKDFYSSPVSTVSTYDLAPKSAKTFQVLSVGSLASARFKASAGIILDGDDKDYILTLNDNSMDVKDLEIVLKFRNTTQTVVDLTISSDFPILIQGNASHSGENMYLVLSINGK